MPISWNTVISKIRSIFSTDERRIMSGIAFHYNAMGNPVEPCFFCWHGSIDLMHWRHVSITTTPCWGSRLVALRAHVLLAERIGAHPLSHCAHPGQLGGEACRGLPSECMLGDGARGVPRLTPNTTGAPFCDVICIWSMGFPKHNNERPFPTQSFAHRSQKSSEIWKWLCFNKWP